MPHLRHMSTKGLLVLQRLEGFRAAIYRDEGGRETVGYGHLVLPEDTLMRRFVAPLTREAAQELLRQDVLRFEVGICGALKAGVSLTAWEYDALVCFAFNVGVGNFCKSTMLRLLNDGAPRAAVADQFARWVYVTDQATGRSCVSMGLRKRRAVEARMFAGGTP